MPIFLIWNTAAAPWLGSFRSWINEFDVAGRSLERWLEKQLSTAERIDRATAGFPIFRFYNMAVSAEISRLQFGSIAPVPDSQFGAQMGRVGQAWNLPAVLGRRITESQLIVNVFGVVEDILGSVVASIDRMANPTAETFDPERARFTDLFGLAALLFNTVGSNREGIYRAGKGLADGLHIDPQPSGGTLTAEAGAVAAPEPDTATWIISMARDFTAQAETLLQYIAAGLMLVPAIGALLLSIGRDIALALRLVVLEFCEETERSALAWRRGFYERFYRGLNAWVDGTMLFMLAIRDAALSQLRFAVRFGVTYLDALAGGVSVFATDLQTFWSGVGGLISAIIDYLGRVLSIDIGDVIHNSLVLFQRIIDFIGDELWEDSKKAPRYHAPDRFAVTIGELVTGTGNGTNAQNQLATAGLTLQRSLQGAHWVSVGVNLGLGSMISGKFLPGLAANTIALTQRLRTPMVAAGTQPNLAFDSSAVPDITGLFVEPARTALTTAVTAIGTSAGTAINGIFTTFGSLADGVATRAEDQAIAALRAGSLQHYNAIVAGSEGLVGRALPNLPVSAPTGLESVAQAYAVWLSGAFEMIGTLLGGFLTTLVDEWRNRIDTNEDATVEVTATSPRKLLERARLGVVRMPEMRIVMNVARTDQQSANDVADTFQRAVGEAYMTGSRRLDTLRLRASSVPI